MKKIFYSAVVLLSSAMALSSCSSRDDDGGGTTYGSVREAMATVAPKPVTISVDAATGGSFSTGKSRLIIPPNAFRTASGGTATGTVSVEVLELLKKGDMTFSRILPISNGNQLVSGGEFRIKASQNGNPLQLNDFVPIELRVPQFGTDATGMQFFEGQQTNDTGANMVNWNRKDQGGSSGGIGAVTINGDTVSIFTDSMGLCNADRFLNNPNYQTFTVTVAGVSAGALSSANVSAYTLYDNYNAVWPMHSFAGNQFSENHIPDIPVHFVVFAVIGGNFYGGTAGATPANGGNYTVTLSQTTPVLFKALVDAL